MENDKEEKTTCTLILQTNILLLFGCKIAFLLVFSQCIFSHLLRDILKPRASDFYQFFL